MRCGSTSPASPICSAASAELVADVQTRFAVAGLSTRVAIAPTAAAAWALAHYGDAPAVICGKDTGAKLADLPVAALRLAAGSRRGRWSGSG